MEIKRHFNIVKIVIAYDHSNDTSLHILRQLQSAFNIHIIINNKQLHSQRTQNIANARNSIMNYLKDFNKHTTIDYFIMMDFDDVCSKPININTLKQAFVHKTNWECVTFNNERYYDFWALSFNEFQFSCWHSNQPYKVIQLMRHHLTKELSKHSTPYILCNSAFNGFGIYNYNTFKDSIYKSIIDTSIFNIQKILQASKSYNLRYSSKNPYDCEHRYFHMSTTKINKARCVIWKDCLFPPYTGEHARFLYK